MKEIHSFNFAHNTEKLKKLIEEYPDYPIVVIAGDEANTGDYRYMYCERVQFEVEEILYADYCDEIIFSDRDDFEESVRENLSDLQCSDEEYEKAVKDTLAKYEPYWKKVIAIYADN